MIDSPEGMTNEEKAPMSLQDIEAARLRALMKFLDWYFWGTPEDYDTRRYGIPYWIKEET